MRVIALMGDAITDRQLGNKQDLTFWANLSLGSLKRNADKGRCPITLCFHPVKAVLSLNMHAV